VGLCLVGAGTAGVVFTLATLSAPDQTFRAGQESLAATQALPESPVVGDENSTYGNTSKDSSGVRLSSIEFVASDGSSRKVFDGPLFIGVGVDVKTLESGPSWYPGTSLPGKRGNVAIAGHRTGWGSPFLKLDELQRGDLVVVTMSDGMQHEYEVKRSFIVNPDADWVLKDEPLGRKGSFLTLTTCDPPGVNDKRLIVVAERRADVSRA
jgi:sortase A